MSRYLILSIAVLVFCFSAAGQTATGIIQGRVSDATGSAVPDARVTVENPRTGVRQSLVTNSEGTFVQPYLIPGAYRVTVEKPGFEKYVTTGVPVNVQQTVALELTLKVGEVTTSVEVIASTVQLARDFQRVDCDRRQEDSGSSVERTQPVCAGDDSPGSDSRTRLNALDQRRQERLQRNHD